MKIGVVTYSIGGLVPQKFKRISMSSKILNASPNAKAVNVANLDIVISSEGRRLASQSTPVEKLSAGPTSAIYKK